MAFEYYSPRRTTINVGDTGLVADTAMVHRAVNDLVEEVAELSAANQVATVADMAASSLPVGAAVRTLGYHTAGDGGACSYRVISAASKSYDINGSGIAFRPVANGTIHPKQFGTVNNGTTLDNAPLQACYDYAADNGIAYIDGQGLLYNIGTTNPYDAAGTRGWSHTGAIVQSGRTLDNFRFKTAAGATNGTVPLAVRMTDDGQPTYIRNTVIDGNEANVAPNTANGREDGGLHGVHLFHPLTDTTAVEAREFYPCGNVYFDNVTIKNAYSYGGRPDTLDCLIQFTDCTFDNAGISFLPHCTRFVVDGATVNLRTPRVGRVGSPFLAEAEFNDDYNGTKLLTANFRRIRYTNAVAGEAFFKIHYVPMNGVDYDTITFEDCTTDTGKLLEVSTRGVNSNPTASVLNIGRIELDAACRTSGEGVNLSSEYLAPNNITMRVGSFRWDGKTGPGLLRVTGPITVDRMVFDSPNFIETGRMVTLGGAVIDRLEVHNIQSPTLGVSGILRDTTAGTTINKLVMRGGHLALLGAANGLFDCNIGAADISGLTINPNESNQHSRLLMTRNATSEITVRDVLLTGTAYRSSSFPLIYSTTMTGGFIHLNNVRHRTAPAEPALGVANLPAGRIIKENVAPLYTA